MLPNKALDGNLSSRPRAPPSPPRRASAPSRPAATRLRIAPRWIRVATWPPHRCFGLKSVAIAVLAAVQRPSSRCARVQDRHRPALQLHVRPASRASSFRSHVKLPCTSNANR
ncbi:hypothetical protein EJB05_44623 [Eragrostis curvula]|uniref:Uncharacterized protein n=1 Tax=Eragrostis curvula TaxID=38414 RepID=A0A5J9TK63_9POAL|nr:hypothetical protein EJB05_44623 [Eragrostis curvula]